MTTDELTALPMEKLNELSADTFKREPKTHDYTRRGWGHDYTFSPENGGLSASMMGWGKGITDGDYLVLPHSEGGTTRYRVETIRYFADPPDMWGARVAFAPRTKAEKGED